MTNLAVFQFDSQDVRFVDGKPVANDVAKVLGYANPSKTVSTKVFAENRSVTKTVTVDGKLRDVTVLEEPGIYQLIFSSKLESAQRFQQWVFAEVLPSIRQTGEYKTVSAPQLPESYLDALKALVKSEEQKLLLLAEKAQLEKENEALAEAVDELFDYSSIIRVAKFNHVHEKAFEWRKLKAASDAMKVEVKRVPCPRFEWKNLYAHDVWRFCYPEMRLPETTTLIIGNKI
jgi:anti-repressor protein